MNESSFSRLCEPVSVPDLVSSVSDETDDRIRRILTKAPPAREDSREARLLQRYELGRVINGEFGSPLRHAAYGKGVMKKLQKALGLDAQVLRDVRWFAELFDGVDAFQAEYPECTGWDRLRRIIWKLRRQERGKPSAATEAVEKAVPVAYRKIKAATEAIGKIHFASLTPKVRRHLGKLFQQLTDEYRYTVMDLSAEVPAPKSV